MINARIIQLPKIEDPRGNLSTIEQCKEIPFDIKRVHWVYDVRAAKTAVATPIARTWSLS